MLQRTAVTCRPVAVATCNTHNRLVRISPSRAWFKRSRTLFSIEYLLARYPYRQPRDFHECRLSRQYRRILVACGGLSAAEPAARAQLWRAAMMPPVEPHVV